MDREKNWGVQPNEVVFDRLPRLLQQQLVQVDLAKLEDHVDVVVVLLLYDPAVDQLDDIVLLHSKTSGKHVAAHKNSEAGQRESLERAEGRGQRGRGA